MHIDKLTVMDNIVIGNSILDEILKGDDNSSTSTSSLIMEFINRLEGWKTKCKNLHWASFKRNIHKYLDEFLDVLIEYQDGLAEEEMGIYGRMLPNVVTGIQSNTVTPKEFIYEVRKLTLAFYDSIPQDSIHSGIKSECETFIHNINKYIYLFSLCDWEFKRVD